MCFEVLRIVVGRSEKGDGYSDSEVEPSVVRAGTWGVFVCLYGSVECAVLNNAYKFTDKR